MSEEKTALVPASATKEVLEMLSEDDIEIGRISAGWDADTDFDALPPRLVDITKEDIESADLFQGEPTEFEPHLEAFPVFKRSLRHFQSQTPQSRAVRIDTDQSYAEFSVDRAAKEFERLAEDLREAAHAEDSETRWGEVLGAVAAIVDLKKADSAGEAVSKLPQVPVGLPDFAQGAVRCWRDGDSVVVSIRFAMPDGSPRIITTASKPRVREDEIERWAENSGVDPITILGATPVIAAVATGKQLVKEAAQSALEAREREDVACMCEDEPMVLIGLGESSAPIAALMHLQQRAEAGDVQAVKELATMRVAANTPLGQKHAAPVLAEASRRLALGRKALNPSLADEYEKLSAFV